MFKNLLQAISRPPPANSTKKPAIASKSTTTLMQKGFSLHQAGELAQAREIYKHILELDPTDYDALYLLGALTRDSGDKEQATRLFSEAISINDTITIFHTALGELWLEKRDWANAERAFRRAAELAPNDGEIWNNLGAALEGLGRIDEAITAFQKALKVQVTLAQAHYNLARQLLSKGQETAAETHFTNVVTLSPNHVPSHLALARIAHAKKFFSAAENHCRTALAAEPENQDACIGLANALAEQGLYAEARPLYEKIKGKSDISAIYYNIGLCEQHIGNPGNAEAAYRRAIELAPDARMAYHNLGIVLMEARRISEALAAFKTALELDPTVADIYVNISSAYQSQRQYEKALTYLNQGYKCDPKNPDIHWNRALALLAMGRLAEAWEDYEWRWDIKMLSKHKRNLARPQWRGEIALGSSLLIHTEQGLGDSLNFIRYATLAAQRCLRVHVLCQPPLTKLFASVEGIASVIPEEEGKELPPYDLHIPLLSLPGVFRTSLETIPANVPYIHPAPDRIAAWKDIIGHSRELKVGLVWAGGTYFKNDRERSCTLSMFAPLATIPGVHFYSLQKGPAADQCQTPPEGMNLEDLSPLLEDFSETAAAISCLDLVISVDTAVAHLTGAIAKPVWTLLAYANDWRWLEHREDSPWYPTMRLFRQASPGAWEEVFEQVKNALRIKASE